MPKVSTATVYRLCARGEPGHVRVLNVIRIPMDDGLRKSGRTFRLTAPRYVLVLNVQASQWSPRDDLEFTVNVAGGRTIGIAHLSFRAGMISALFRAALGLAWDRKRQPSRVQRRRFVRVEPNSS